MGSEGRVVNFVLKDHALALLAEFAGFVYPLLISIESRDFHAIAVGHKLEIRVGFEGAFKSSSGLLYCFGAVVMALLIVDDGVEVHALHR